jgi:hypothetical protein
MTTLAAIDPNKNYICVEAHCSPALNGQVMQYKRVVRGSDPAVKAAPRLFEVQGTPEAEWKTPFDEAVAANDQKSRELEDARKAREAAASKSNRLKLDAPTTRVLKRDVQTVWNGEPATLGKGSHVPSDHPLIDEHPEAF